MSFNSLVLSLTYWIPFFYIGLMGSYGHGIICGVLTWGAAMAFLYLEWR